MTTKIHNVVVQIHGPTSSGDPGTVAEGRYTFEDNTITLVDHLGNPVRDKDGKKYCQKLNPGEDHRTIAGRLTKTFRTARLGKEKVEGFNRKINYPDLGYV
jgi:hypothetical protein